MPVQPRDAAAAASAPRQAAALSRTNSSAAAAARKAAAASSSNTASLSRSTSAAATASRANKVPAKSRSTVVDEDHVDEEDDIDTAVAESQRDEQRRAAALETRRKTPASATSSGGASSEQARQLRETLRRLPSSEVNAVRDLCEANGISEARMIERNDSIKRIEMFMMNFPAIRGVEFFPSIVELSITMQEVNRIANLGSLQKLERLWLSENRIARIEGLDNLTNLQELYLYSNKIRHVDNLSQCTNLKRLWLADNKIGYVGAASISALTNLEEINLASNTIETVGDVLLPLTKLTTLNLAANKIGSFREVSALARLPSLTNLALSDPHWGSCPVSELCNYHTYALFHLGSSLKQLDTLELQPDAISVAEATFMKKRMYYNMRCKTLKRNTTDAIRRADDGMRCVLRRAHLARALVVCQARAYEREVALCGGIDAAPAGPNMEALEAKLAQLRGVAAVCEQQAAATEAFFGEAERRTHELADAYTRRMIVELETGGNVRLEDGKPSDLWYTSCVDLVHSRFFSEDFAQYGITGIRVTRVSRVHNRFLRTRFETALSEKVDTSDASHKRTMEYLFYGEPLSMRGELQRAAEEGFRPPSEYASLGLDGAVVLSNSVSLCDNPRLDSGTASTSSTISATMRSLKRGRLLVTKVFLGKCVAEDAAAKAASRAAAGAAAGAPRVTKEAYGEVDSVYRANDAKQRLWFVFNPHFCLPEYVVDFEYEVAQPDETYAVPSAVPSDSTGASEDGSAPADSVRAMPLISSQPESSEEAALRSAELAHFPPEVRSLAASLAPFLPMRSSSMSSKGERDWDSADGGREDAVASVRVLGVQTDEAADDSNHGSNAVPEAVDSLAAANRLTAAMSACINGGAVAGGNVSACTPVLENVIGHAGGSASTVARALCAAPVVSKGRRLPSLSSDEDVQGVVDELKSGIEKAALRQMTPTDPGDPDLSAGMKAVFGVQTVEKLSDITRVDLHGRDLSSLNRFAKMFPDATTLLASFNAIEMIEDIGSCSKLRVLDLSFNRIYRIDGLKGLGELQCLILDGNPIHRLEDVNMLRKYTPNLTELSMYGCPVRSNRRYYGVVRRRLPSLRRLDGQVVHPMSSSEYPPDDLNGVGCTLTPALLMEGAHTRRRTLLSWSGKGDVTEELASSASAANGARGTPTPEWWASVHEICIEHRNIRRLQNLQAMGYACRRVSFCDNDIARIENLETLTHLEELSLEDNRIELIEGLGQCALLRRLDLGRNCIRRIDDSLMHLDRLTQLSLEDNMLTSLAGLEHLTALMELYVGNNRINACRELQTLKKLPRLIILDLMGNPLCSDEKYRLYAVFHLARLKVLDGVSIETAEISAAKSKYAGVLSTEWLEEKVGHTCFSRLRDLDMSGHRLKDVGDVFVRDGSFLGLERLRLDGNNLASLAGLRGLASLCVLCVNSNKLGDGPICGPLTEQSQLFWKKRESDGSEKSTVPSDAELLTPNWAAVTRAGGFPSLEVLQLGGNGISSLSSLSLAPLGRRLRSLFLQDNDLTSIDGLDGLGELRELVLDRNRLKAIDASSFQGCPLLREVRVEENLLRSLGGFESLPKLRVLRLGHNRLNDLNELEKLEANVELVELVLFGNPLSRRPQYRANVVRRLPSLLRCDGKDVTAEERESADIAAMAIASGASDASGVGIANGAAGAGAAGFASGGKVPLRMTSISFADLTLDPAAAIGYYGGDVPITNANVPRGGASGAAGVSKELLRDRLSALQQAVGGNIGVDTRPPAASSRHNVASALLRQNSYASGGGRR
ncbi:U2 small nuclear ribonucleoprotein A [Pycnococcus provasolii]